MKVVVIKYPTPILSAGILRGNVFALDALWVYHPVAVQKGKQYFMFYSGKSIQPGIAHTTLLATSADLSHWTKHGTMLTNGAAVEWDSDFTAHAYVFSEKNKYYMFYDGSSKGNWLEEIGLAESRDLLHWKKFSANPVFKAGREWWEKRHVSRCSVFKKNNKYYLFYAGHDGKRERIGLAIGSSLTKFLNRFPEPVLDVGKKGDWDEQSISDPRILAWKDKYLMFYSGFNASSKECTGLAVSLDLINWTKYTDNPILKCTPGAWDAISASRAFPLVKKEKIYLFYSGRKKFIYHIGLAEVILI